MISDLIVSTRFEAMIFIFAVGAAIVLFMAITIAVDVIDNYPPYANPLLKWWHERKVRKRRSAAYELVMMQPEGSKIMDTNYFERLKRVPPPRMVKFLLSWAAGLVMFRVLALPMFMQFYDEGLQLLYISILTVFLAIYTGLIYKLSQ